MIERNLQFVTVRKYGSAFLEAFGMLPLTYFGAIGDNLTDNYANIQVAINESIKRELNYIFVPNGTYFYQGNLVDVEQITFIGNSKYAKIYDGENEIPIYQIGCQMPYLKGEEDISVNLEEDGYIDIPVSVKNPVEAILVINDLNENGKKTYYVADTLNLMDGALMEDAKFNSDVNITKIELIPGAIRIYYTLETTPASVDAEIEWRVR